MVALLLPEDKSDFTLLYIVISRRIIMSSIPTFNDKALGSKWQLGRSGELCECLQLVIAREKRRVLTIKMENWKHSVELLPNSLLFATFTGWYFNTYQPTGPSNVFMKLPAESPMKNKQHQVSNTALLHGEGKEESVLKSRCMYGYNCTVMVLYAMHGMYVHSSIESLYSHVHSWDTHTHYALWECNQSFSNVIYYK